jgi:hypothetical protein
MRQRSVAFAILCTVLLSGSALISRVSSHYPSARSTDYPDPETDCRAETKAFDSQTLQAWRQGQPRHWRACLLQHP